MGIFGIISRVAKSDAPAMIIGERDRGKCRGRDHPRALPAALQAVRRDQLRGDLAVAHRERALRPRARLVHRRRQAAAGILRARQRRDPLLRRSHGDVDGAPDQAPARARDPHVPTRRRQRGAQGQHPDTVEHQPRPAGSDPGRSRGAFLLPAERLSARLPPLRDRKEDIAPLAQHFPSASRRAWGSEIEADAITALLDHPWPGNVRERNVIHRAYVLSNPPVIGVAAVNSVLGHP